MSTLTSNMTTAFVDLATYDEMEKYMYGGSYATAYFCRETKKSTWFTQVPVVLSRSSGETKFGNDWSVNISRAGDYLLGNWLTLTIPPTTVKASTVQPAAGYKHAKAYVQWTPNLMHNLISDCYISFNDLVAAQFNNFHLDFWASFSVPASKSKAYNNMIGNNYHTLKPVDFTFNDNVLPGGTFHLPLPFFYSRDSGVALPTAALPYNDMKINFTFRDWTELINVWTVSFNDISTDTYQTSQVSQKCDSENLNDLFTPGVEPTITNCNVWANYAIVSNDERKKMACAPRDILIEQVQWNTPQKVTNGFSNTLAFPKGSGTGNQVSIRYAHAIKVLFFAIRNSTYSNYLSNYNTRTPMWGVTLNQDSAGNNITEPALTFPGEASVLGIGPNFVPNMDNECNGIPLNAETSDPLNDLTLTYESTARLSQLKCGYYSMVNPYFTAPRVPVAEVSAGQTVSLGRVLARNNHDLESKASRGLNGPSVVPSVSDNLSVVSRDYKSNRISSNYSDMIAGMAWGNYPTGVHCYSYSLDFNCLDPMGSTNYGKLTNIVVNYSLSNDAAYYGNSCQDTRLYIPHTESVSDDQQYVESTVHTEKNNYEFLITAINNNIIRISGGALGFPVL